jgi:hypothetical protein
MEKGIFSLPPCPDWFWGPLNLTYVFRNFCPEIQKVETETNQSPRPSAEIEYVDLYLPSPLYFHGMVFT